MADVELTVPTRVDGLLAETARRYPDRTALIAEGTGTTFGALEQRTRAVAAALRDLLPQPGERIAVAAVLHPDFPVAYYATMRAGHVAAVVNPLLREEGLLHVLGTCEARVAFVDAALYARIGALRDRLPHLERVVLIGGASPAGPADTTLEALAETAPAGTPYEGGDDVACLHFTSGTTGLPKAVRLTHRNLTVNAAQITYAHRLDAASVTLNHLPTYHPMHLNSAVHAGAPQILFAGPDPAEALAAADRYGATHYYSLPVRLARLADAAEPAGPAPRALRYVASGGSALPPHAAARLGERLGVPVFQGYGLAETSPLTHSDDADAPVHGSVGRPVLGTECRIVDVDTRAVLAPGEAGEVEVRGPQVMAGYLGGGGVGADGWFATGDVGRVDTGGRLFLVDRLKDVFKCDNFLVAPSDVERALLDHPAVAEAVVVDLPHPYSSAVAGALLVLADPAATPEAVLADVNPRLPYYQRVQDAVAVPAIPRNGNGKIQRRDLRTRLLDLTRGPSSQPRPTPNGKAPAMAPEFTVVNTFTLKDPAEAAHFEEHFGSHVQWMRAQGGFRAHQAVRDLDTPGTYVNIGWWATPQDFKAVLGSETFQAHAAEFHRIVDVEADPSMGVLRVAENEGGQAQYVTVADVTGDAGEFETAYRAYAEAARALDGFAWLDLARSLPRPGRYTAVESWRDADAARRARELPEYAALAALTTSRTVTAAPVIGTR
ncbi:AMP-binding protein [Streptomyces sp. L2]|uniref:AMP-binding protein n=1 Tax=Streptomyces sp. L2 TaxID=2162665 RepID=UPI0010133190|nr:AMP-binding protein [Streptomyces sp. L2]